MQVKIIQVWYVLCNVEVSGFFSMPNVCHFFFRFFVVHISYIHVLGHQGINENRILFISGTNETPLKGRFITVVVSVLKMIVDVVAVIIISVQQGSIFDTLSVIEFSLSHDMSKNRGPHASTLGIKQFFFIAFKVQRLVVMVFNATFNNILFISWRVSFLVEENLQKTANLVQVTDKLDHIMLY